MHASTRSNRRSQPPTYVTLTRRLQGAHASGDAYRKGRHGFDANVDGTKPASSNQSATVLPFRPR